MRNLRLYLLTACLLGISIPTFSQNESIGINPPQEAVEDIADQAAMFLEGQRILSSLSDLSSFPTYFWFYVSRLMRSHPDVTFTKLEESFRKYGTSLYLIAVPKSEVATSMNDRELCLIYPNSINGGRAEPEYGTYLVVGDAESALLLMQRFGTKNPQENFQKLRKAGILELCDALEEANL